MTLEEVKAAVEALNTAKEVLRGAQDQFTAADVALVSAQENHATAGNNVSSANEDKEAKRLAAVEAINAFASA